MSTTGAPTAVEPSVPMPVTERAHQRDLKGAARRVVARLNEAGSVPQRRRAQANIILRRRSHEPALGAWGAHTHDSRPAARTTPLSIGSRRAAPRRTGRGSELVRTSGASAPRATPASFTPMVFHAAGHLRAGPSRVRPPDSRTPGVWTTCAPSRVAKRIRLKCVRRRGLPERPGVAPGVYPHGVHPVP